MSKHPAPENQRVYPSAPPALFSSNDFSQRAPPPSYEESLKMSTPLTNLPSPYYAGQGVPLAPGTSYGYVNPYQVHVQQQQRHYNPMSTSFQSACTQPTQPSPSNAQDKNRNVLLLAKGAKLRTAPNGAISIPPPPPGCTPSAAQLAAMKGQPVLVKKQKGSFF
ncbi:uncharacterized protein ACN427_004652 [Glossina fuscipes fuscipes]